MKIIIIIVWKSTIHTPTMSSSSHARGIPDCF